MSDQTGKLKHHWPECPNMCDECGKVRNRGDHTECAKARQARYAKR